VVGKAVDGHPARLVLDGANGLRLRRVVAGGGILTCRRPPRSSPPRCRARRPAPSCGWARRSWASTSPPSGLPPGDLPRVHHHVGGVLRGTGRLVPERHRQDHTRKQADPEPGAGHDDCAAIKRALQGPAKTPSDPQNEKPSQLEGARRIS
jgi:hypothetical protein